MGPMSLPQLTLIPCLQPQVAKLIASTDFGLKRPALVANFLCSSAPLSERIAKSNHVADKFVVAIPYAEDFIYCHVSFCYDNPKQFPRIIVLKRRPMVDEDLEELEIADFFPLYANQLNSQDECGNFRSQGCNGDGESPVPGEFPVPVPVPVPGIPFPV
uniref:ZP domain-containing protein n=1 Tax=Plectus sambesii TaxID=2011161 RepID=A0A914VME3_9BILA